MATTLGTRLAACLQAAGMHCPSCGGYGSCVYNSADMCYERCPTCGGDGIAPEYKPENDRCPDCDSVMDMAPSRPVCHRCRAEAAADFPYVERP